MNLPRCVIYLAWYGCIPFTQTFCSCVQFTCLFNLFVECDQTFNPEPVVPPVSARPDHVEKVLKTRYYDAKNKLPGKDKDLDLLIVILPDNNGSLYGNDALTNL